MTIEFYKEFSDETVQVLCGVIATLVYIVVSFLATYWFFSQWLRLDTPLTLRIVLRIIYEYTIANLIGASIGSLCRAFRTNKQKEFFKQVLKHTRAKYPHAFIHVWGAGITNVKHMVKYVNSFDNSKWTRPVQTKTLPNHGAKNLEERRLFFDEYLRVIEQKKREEEKKKVLEQKLVSWFYGNP